MSDNNNGKSVSTPLPPQEGHGGRSYMFQTRMEVRDYECDIQGIVNNANYLHYLEHTRHCFLRSKNMSFAELHEQGVDVVVARMDLQYKVPLKCDDEFISCLNVTKEGIRYIFKQDIFRASDDKLCIRAKVELVGLRDGKLAMTPEYDVILPPTT